MRGSTRIAGRGSVPFRLQVSKARVGCEGGDELEAGARAADHRDRDGVVQRDDGIVGTAAIAAWS